MGHPMLTINGNVFSPDQIVNESVDPATPFEKSTLHFCRDWLKGNSSFTLHTSGSTGAPKSITFTRDQMIASARMTQAALGLNQNDTALVCLDTNYIAGQMMLVRCFVVGMKIIAVEPTANPFENLEQGQQIDFVAMVPYQLQHVINSNEHVLNQIRIAIVGGAPLDSQLKSKLMDYTCQLYATYGMTETISHVALQKINGPFASGSFKALPGVALRTDERGCLVISTSFLDNDIVTNDLVELINESEFKWSGRWDNIINTGGVKVIPEKIEIQLEEIFGKLGVTNRFFIFGIPDQNLGQKVSLWIEGDPFSDMIQGKFLQELKVMISKYEIPKEIKFVKAFQETATGKVNRAKTVNLFPV